MHATMSDSPIKPWYRQLWPWLLISLPASAVVAGFVTLGLALHTDDSLVVDDYYRQGKAINRELGRDRHAAEIGLAAEFSSAPDGLRLRLSARTLPDLPQKLPVQLVHGTRANFDRTLEFTRIGGADYVAPGATLPADGHWTLHIESPDGQWRLVARLTGGRDKLRIEAQR